ncbi:MAG: YbaK/EbsC family protein [Dermatophilaceae bacterium]
MSRIDPRAARLDHPSVAAVRAVLAERARRVGRPEPEVTVLPDAVRTAQAAADALGVTAAQIANSLIFVAVHVDGRRTPLLVLASGGARVDTDLLARLAGLAALERADADYVRTETGFAIGGVAPVGHRTASGDPLRTIVDTDLAQYEQVWAAAGHSHTVFPTTYEDLLDLTGGEPSRVR